MKTMLKKIRKNSERGQAIILIAFAIVGLVAIVGLMVDGGILLIEYARLKRGIDSASIAAAAQFRKNFVADDLQKAGEEFLQFNQSTSEVTISICDPSGSRGTVAAPALGARHDPLLCPVAGAPARKLVRVTATRHVDFGFMRVVGMNGTDITATSVGEAASIDMILAIDTSSSMAYETTGSVLDPNYATNCPGIDCVHPLKPDPSTPGHPNGDDPDVCNSISTGAGRCQPLGLVKDAAVNFVNEMFYPYDRVAVVTFTQQIQNGTATRKPQLALAFNDNQDDSVSPPVATTEIQTAINELKVFRPRNCPSPLSATDLGPCLKYDATGYPNGSHYAGQTCGALTGGGVDPTSCGASNIGGGLYLAGDQFGNGARQDSFWVVISLLGGPANAGVLNNAADANAGFCPGSAGNPTWIFPVFPATSPATYTLQGFCRDRDPMPYALASNPRRTVDNSTSPPTYPALYDADDYARDAADYITSPEPGKGQGATLFAICMGAYCQEYPALDDPASAEHLGQYMALNAGDNLPSVTANHGLYFYAVDPNALGGVFTKIAENIFTRISQ
jgi:hypothetical protein